MLQTPYMPLLAVLQEKRHPDDSATQYEIAFAFGQIVTRPILPKKMNGHDGSQESALRSAQRDILIYMTCQWPTDIYNMQAERDQLAAQATELVEFRARAAPLLAAVQPDSIAPELVDKVSTN